MIFSRFARFLGATAVVEFLTLFAILIALHVDVVYEPPSLLPILNTVFLTGTLFVVAYISARSFLMSGSPNLLLLGSGVFSLGFASLIAGLVISSPGPNATATIHNIGALLSSALTFMAAVLTVRTPRVKMISGHRGLGLALTFLGVSVSMAVVTLAVYVGAIPVFFVQGVGPTLLRQVVLGTAIALFTVSSLLLLSVYMRSTSRSGVLYWYSLGLGLITVGLLGVFVQTAVGSPVGWAGRAAQYLGSIYFLVAVWTGIRHAGGGE